MEALVQGRDRRESPASTSGIAKYSERWRIERMPAVDRNILRMAIFEMMQGETPAAVVIDEAIELARKFSGEGSAPFVNGVLGFGSEGIEAESVVCRLRSFSDAERGEDAIQDIVGGRRPGDRVDRPQRAVKVQQ